MTHLYLKRKFAAAHYLPGHPKCGAMHGHTFEVRVKLKGRVDLSTGMVMDFKKVKDIIDRCDHCVLNDVLPNWLLPPTAENLALYFLYEIPLSVRICVWESESCFAEAIARPPRDTGHPASPTSPRWEPPNWRWLDREYCWFKKTRSQIAREIGVSSPTVKKWILNAGIVLRSPWKVPSEKWLKDQYIAQEKSASQIADEVGTGTNVILKKLRALGIKPRTLKQSQGLRRQQEFPHLKGQHSLRTCRRHAEEALWAAEVPEVCARCQRTSSETWIEVHHLDGNERNNSLKNLQWLCRSCHMYTRREVT